MRTLVPNRSERGVLDGLLDGLFGSASDTDEPGGRWWPRYLALAGVLAAVVIGRRPDAILRPQFWGDDNTLFLQQLTLGFWPSLRLFYAGFPYLDYRVVAGLAALGPFVRAPLVYNLSAITLTALAMATFSLPHFRHLVRSDWLRAGVCLGLVCMPAGQELLGTLTNVGFFLAIWLVFISVMRAPRTTAGLIAWGGAGLLAVFSTPVAPIAAPLWALRAVHGLRERRRPDLAFAATQLAGLASIYLLGGASSAGLLTQLPGQPPAMAWHVGHLLAAFRWLGWVLASYLVAALMPESAFAHLETRGTLPVVVLALLVAAGLALAIRDLTPRGGITVGLALYLLVGSLLLVLAGRPVTVQLLRGELLPDARIGTLHVIGPRHRAVANAGLLLLVAGLVDGARHAGTRIAAAVVAGVGLLAAWGTQLRVPAYPDLRWPLWAARLEEKLATGNREPLIIPSYPVTYEIRLDAPTADGTSSEMVPRREGS